MCLVEETALETPIASVLGFLRRRTLVLALRSAFIVSLLWFLYWIGYDVVVWGKPLIRVNFVNYTGAVLSLAVILAGFRLRAKKMVDASNGWQDEEQKTALEQDGVGEEAHVVEQGGEEDETRVVEQDGGEQPPVLRGLEEQEGSLAQEKQDLLALKERPELETREKVDVRKRDVDALKSQVAELKRQVEELRLRLRAMQ
jgi:hypothetical protein